MLYFLLSKNSIIIEVNDRFVVVLDFKVNDIVGKNLNDLFLKKLIKKFYI